MRNIGLKKLPAIFITTAILFTTIFSMSIYANATSNFSARLSAPSYSNKYYYSDINLFYKYGYGMPNCTAYAYGRAYEILGSEPNLCRYSAEEWYDYNKSNGYYSYGKTPKLGAIACWSYDGGGGHVAVVEKIEDSIITLSNSAYNGTEFYLTTAETTDSNVGGSSWWNFQGYIYIINNTSDTTASSSLGTYKTNVPNSSLNMRSGAGTSYSVVASISNGVSLDVTQIKSSGGYTWGYTTYNGTKGWIALEYCTFVEAPTTQSTTKATTHPTTVQPTTLQPTTAQPTTVQPTTSQPATAVTEPSESDTEGLGVADIDADGMITILDATLIREYIADLVELTEGQIKNSDVDFDGKVDIVDATIIQSYLLVNP